MDTTAAHSWLPVGQKYIPQRHVQRQSHLSQPPVEKDLCHHQYLGEHMAKKQNVVLSMWRPKVLPPRGQRPEVTCCLLVDGGHKCFHLVGGGQKRHCEAWCVVCKGSSPAESFSQWEKVPCGLLGRLVFNSLSCGQEVAIWWPSN